MRKAYGALQLIFLSGFLLASCSQPSSLANLDSTATEQDSEQAIVASSSTATPETSSSTATPETPSSIATPEATPSPSPAPATSSTVVDSYGFTLEIDGSVDIGVSGLLEEEPRTEDGIVFFEYGGANTTFLWLAGSKGDELLSDLYMQLVDAHPELTFSLDNKGTMPVDSSTGSYLTFFSNTAAGEATGAGLTGGWECPNRTAYSLTVTGSDEIVLAIRFKRLLDGFRCS